MKLIDWLHQERMSQTRFALVMGVDNARVSDWVNGKAIPSLASAVAIERATNGAVSPADFLTEAGSVQAAGAVSGAPTVPGGGGSPLDPPQVLGGE